MKPLALLAGLMMLVATPAFAQVLTVKGPTGQTVALTPEQIEGLPRVKVTYTAHGETHEYEGPLLIDLLANVGIPKDKEIRGTGLAQAILVTSADGYQIVLGVAEADPNTRKGRIILADRADGKPLDAKTGPFKLVVEDDLRPARGAKMVTTIEVVNLASPPAK